MKNQGYDKFFKAARDARGEPAQPVKRPVAPKGPREDRATDEALQEVLRSRIRARRAARARQRQKTPWLALGVTVLGTFVAGVFVTNPGLFDRISQRLEIGWFGLASAEQAAAPAKSAAAGTPAPAKAAAAGPADGAATKDEKPSWTAEDISHFSKLNERKKELDQREAELNELEEELQRQKSVVEERIRKLEEIREQIATILKERVEVDEAKVDKLVEFYSNMKPKQAAEIIGTLNEDLAVEVLGRMKKKNAAEIMNLLKPDKAQVLSEKFTGYKRR